MLSGHLHVIWQENETIGYKAHICCSKLLSYSYSGCSDTCPQFQAISSCTTASNGSGTKSRQCSMRVFEYFEYKIYLSGEQDGCELTGKMIKIRPRLRCKYNSLYWFLRGSGGGPNVNCGPGPPKIWVLTVFTKLFCKGIITLRHTVCSTLNRINPLFYLSKILVFFVLRRKFELICAIYK